MPPARRLAPLLGAIVLLACRTGAAPAQVDAPPAAASPDAARSSAPASGDAPSPGADPDAGTQTCPTGHGCEGADDERVAAAGAAPAAAVCEGGERCDAATPCPDAEACYAGCCLPLAIERCALVMPAKIGWRPRSPWEVDAASGPLLDAIAATLRRLGSPRAEVEVHTEATASSTYGMKPTQRRADAIRRELVARGVDPASLYALGYGEERPIASNETAEGRALNRRVEVVLDACRRAAAGDPP
ncbi:MAG: OmpA family protein [Nannocystaceae bacterium]